MESDSPTNTGASANPEISWDSLPSKQIPLNPSPAFPSLALPSFLTVVPQNTGSFGASCVPRAAMQAAMSRAWKQPTGTPKASLAHQTERLCELVWALAAALLPVRAQDGDLGSLAASGTSGCDITPPCPHTPAARPHLT